MSKRIQPISSSASRLVQLDMLRAVAIWLVLGRHLQPPSPDVPYELSAAITTWIRGGWIGVDLFFVLSGFLVSGLLFREYQRRGTASVGRFLLRRGWKIYPAFWVLLLVTLAMKMRVHEPVRSNSVLVEALFVQSYAFGLWQHTWSLAVEEHFYLLLAGLTAWFARNSRRHVADPFRPLPAIFLGLAIGCLYGRILIGDARPYNNYTHLFGTHLRLDSLLFGVVLSYGWHFHGLDRSARLIRAVPLLYALGAILVVPAFLFPLETTPWLSSYGLTFLYMGCGALLLAMLHTPMQGSRATRVVAAIGACSYSIYLWHLAVAFWLIPAVEHMVGGQLPWMVYALTYLTGANVVGVLAAKVIEYPMLRIRDRVLLSDDRRRAVEDETFTEEQVATAAAT